MKSGFAYKFIIIFPILIGPFLVYCQIETKYRLLGGEKGVLGKPVMLQPEDAARGGKLQVFKKGNIYWHPGSGAWAVYGQILQKYLHWNAEGGELGYPISDVMKTPDKRGEFCKFERGNIYWSEKTKAQVVKGRILEKWKELSFERGILGYPVSEELKTPDQSGSYQLFEHGSVYFSNFAGTHEVHGSILKKWKELEYERGILGYPVSDELNTPDKSGKFQKFQHGNIYWAPNTGAYEVHGDILKKYGEFGFEMGILGYPKTDEIDGDNENRGRVVYFENGIIYWTPETGAHGFHGKESDVLRGYGAWKFHIPGRIYLGYPVSDAIHSPDAKESFYIEFENGKLMWGPSFEDHGKVKIWYNELGKWVDEKYK